MKMIQQTKCSTCPHLRYEVENEGVQSVFIIPNDTGIPDLRKVLCLSGVSLFIWDSLENGKAFDDMCLEISRKYETDLDMVRQDGQEYVQKLIENHYVNRLEQ